MRTTIKRPTMGLDVCGLSSAILVTILAAGTFLPLYLTIMVGLGSLLVIISLRSENIVTWRDYVAEQGVALLFLSGVVGARVALYHPSASKQLAVEFIAASIFVGLATSRVNVTFVLKCAVGLSVLYSLRGLWRFYISYKLWSGMGFTGLSEFRTYVTLVSPHVAPGSPNVVYIILVWMAIVVWERCGSSWLLQYVSLLSGILAGTCVLLSFSRGLYLSAFLCAIPIIRSKVAIMYGLLICALLFQLAPRSWLQRSPILTAIRTTSRMNVTVSQRLSTTGRWMETKEGLIVARAYALKGAGPANYPVAAHISEHREGPCVLSQPFNEFLTLVVEQGLFGLMSFLLIIYGVAVRSIGKTKENRRFADAQTLSLLAALTCYCCFESFLFATVEGAVWTFLAFGIAKRLVFYVPNTSTKTPDWQRLALCVCLFWVVIAMNRLSAARSPVLTGRSSRPQDALFFIDDPYQTYLGVCARGRKELSSIDAGRVAGEIPKLTDNGLTDLSGTMDQLAFSTVRLPAEDSAWNNLSLMYLATGHSDQAEVSIDRALDLCGEDYRYHLTRAVIAVTRNDLDLARMEYGTAIELYPSLISSPLWTRMAREQPWLSGAAVKFALSVQLKNYSDSHSPKTAAILARLFASTRDWQEAQTYSDLALEALPNLAGTWELRGELLLNRGQDDQAEAAFQKALFLNPTDVAAYEHDAVLQLKRGDLDVSLKSARKALSIRSSGSTISANRALLMYSYDRAIPAGNDAIFSVYSRAETEPSFDFISLFNELAKRYSELGDDASAITCTRLSQKLFEPAISH